MGPMSGLADELHMQVGDDPAARFNTTTRFVRPSCKALVLIGALLIGAVVMVNITSEDTPQAATSVSDLKWDSKTPTTTAATAKLAAAKTKMYYYGRRRSSYSSYYRRRTSSSYYRRRRTTSFYRRRRSYYYRL